MEKNKIIKTLFIVGFNILILFLLTPLVLSIPKRGYFPVKKASLENLQNLKNDFTYQFESIYFNEDVRRSVDISGYAYFAPSPSEIKDKKIILILSSSSDTYFVDTDLTDIFYLRPKLVESKITGSWHGFRTTFSPMGMKNGTYDLYLYCYENDRYVGYVKTDKVFTKRFGQFIQESVAAN